MGGEQDGAIPEVNRNHLTLRFKNGKTTALVSALPTDLFRDIKQELIRGLSSVGLTSINGHEVPSDPDQIELALPIDPMEPTKGWVPLEITDDGDTAMNGSAETSKALSVLNGTPKGAGLKDGAMLAFRFLAPGQTEGDPDEEWDAQVASLDDADELQDVTDE